MTVTSAASVSTTVVAASPPGVRAGRRSWRDPRLLFGVLLVVGSVAGMTWVLQESDETTAVWSVKDDVPAGGALSPDALVPVPVQLPDIGPYLLADEPLPDGAVASRDFAAGELLTMVGIDSGGGIDDVREVTLPVLRNQMPADLAVGDRVDVYVVERGAAGEPDGPPQLVLRNAIVADVSDDAGAFGGTSLEAGVALSVDAERVPSVVDAQARGTVTLVDVPVGSS